MPHCILWNATDWQFAHDTGVLVARFHEGQVNVAPEVRQRERMMGTTFDSRREIRVRYVDQAAEVEGEGAEVASMADYQALVGA